MQENTEKMFHKEIDGKEIENAKTLAREMLNDFKKKGMSEKEIREVLQKIEEELQKPAN